MQQLPEGFVLDKVQEDVTSLPEGFVLDKKEEEEKTRVVPTTPSPSSTLPPGFTLDSKTSETITPDQTSFQMEDLDTNQDWLRNAATIYESEEGEKFKGSQKKLAEWLKDRHSELGFDMTSMAWMAANADELDPEVQKAWANSMDMYENTDADTMSFFRALKNMGQDPTTWGSIIATMGVGTIAKMFGTKAAGVAAKFQIKEQLKKALMKRGLSEEAAKEVAQKGATKGLQKETLQGARKEAARKVAQAQTKTGAVAGAGYAGSADAMLQDINIDLKRQDEYDPLQTGIAVGIGTVFGGGLGRGMPKLAEKIGRRKALLKNEHMQDTLANQAITPGARTASHVLPKEGSDSVIENAQQASKELEVGGIVDITFDGARARTRKERENITIPEKEPTKPSEKIKYNANKEKKENLSIEEIQDIFNQEGITVARSKRLGTNKLIGRKYSEPMRLETSPSGTPISIKDKVMAVFKRGFYTGGGADKAAALGDLRVSDILRKRMAALASGERIVHNRFNNLKAALKKEVGPLKDIPESFFQTINRAWAGDSDALREVSEKAGRETIEQINGMRDDVKYYQKLLIDTEEAGGLGAIKEGSDLFQKITKSMETDGEPELYVTRQYEIYDNPDWGSVKWQQSPDGQLAISKAKDFLRGQIAQKNQRFASALLKKNQGKTLTQKEQQLIDAYTGKGGYIDEQITAILSVNSHDDLMTAFSKLDQYGKAPLKILTKRQDIPKTIRELMGEYKDPFANYANTMLKLYQTAATFDYEKEIAKRIKAGEIEGAGTLREISELGVTPTKLTTFMPQATGVEKPLGEGVGLIKPLESFYATPEIGAFIHNGNEIARTFGKTARAYLMLQGHTRSAKTVWSPTAIARNFLGSGMMAMGAGYLQPRHIKGIMDVAQGLSRLSNKELRDHIQKGIALGYIQSGTELGAFRGALKDAGQKSFWELSSPSEINKQGLVARAKQLNTNAVKLYQSMDDMWKELAFRNEKDSYRKILQEQNIDPDEVVRRIRGGDATSPDDVIEITRLDEYAASKVADHMQNYAAVPQFIKYVRLLPMADFLAFTTEMLRTSKNIYKSGINEARDGIRQMKRGERNEDGSLKGRAQFLLGMKRLGSIIAAQSAAPAMAGMSAAALGLDQHEPGMPMSKELAMRKLSPEWERDANFLYLDEPNEKGEGFKINLDYVNPWAKMEQPLNAAIEAVFDPSVRDDRRIEELFFNSMVKPIKESLGPSMFAEALGNIFMNVDRYGRPVFGETDTGMEKLGKSIEQFWTAYEPGFVKTAKDIATSTNLDRREMSGITAFGPSRVGVKQGKAGTKLFLTDEIAGLTGIKPKHYNLRQAVNFKAKEIAQNMKESMGSFQDAVREMQPQTTDDIVEAYETSLEKQFTQAENLFDLITTAKSTGMSNKDIYLSLTKEGLFPKAFTKPIIRNMIEKGRYIPPPPVSKDIILAGEFIKKTTGQMPPVREALAQLKEVYRSYAGSITG